MSVVESEDVRVENRDGVVCEFGSGFSKFSFAEVEPTND